MCENEKAESEIIHTEWADAIPYVLEQLQMHFGSVQQ